MKASPPDLAARIRMGPDEVRSFAGPGPLHTDDLPVIAYHAPKDIYRNTRKKNMIPPRPPREGSSSSAWRPRTEPFSPEEGKPRCATCLVP